MNIEPETKKNNVSLFGKENKNNANSKREHYERKKKNNEKLTKLLWGIVDGATIYAAVLSNVRDLFSSYFRQLRRYVGRTVAIGARIMFRGPTLTGAEHILARVYKREFS